MKKSLAICAVLAALAFAGCSSKQQSTLPSDSISWSGYTNWWNSDYKQMHRLGNLSKIAVPDAEKVLQQRRFDLAVELGLPYLQMQEGFLDGLLGEHYEILDNPS